MTEFAKANQLKQEGKLEEAVVAYHRAIDQNPNFYWAYHNLAEALVQMGRLGEAVESYKKAIELNPKNAWDYQYLASTLFEVIRKDPHFLYDKYWSEIEPKITEIKKDKLRLDDNKFLQEHKNLSDVNFINLVYLTYLKRSADVGGQEYYLQNLGGGLWSRQEMLVAMQESLEFKLRLVTSFFTQDVVDAYQKAIELSPSYQCYYQLAEVLQTQDKIEEAITCCQKALEIKPSFKAGQEELNKLLSQKNVTLLSRNVETQITPSSEDIKPQQQLINAPQKSEIEVIFYDLPATSGSYLLDVLEKIYPQQIYYQNVVGENFISQLEKQQINQKFKVITGHFTIGEYQGYFPEAKRIVFLRNPIDRLISLYLYWKYHNFSENEGTNFMIDSIKAGKMSIVQLAEIPNIGNEMVHFLTNYKLSDLDFVGITEFIEEDVLELKARLNWPDISMSQNPVNANPSLNYTAQRLEILSDYKTMSQLLKLTQEDAELYQEALKLRRKRRNEFKLQQIGQAKQKLL